MDASRNTKYHDEQDIHAYIANRQLRTSKLGVKKFVQYLNAYESYWTPQGVRLTTGDDLYFEAMGRRK